MMRSVQRTLAIFDCFTAQRTSLTLQEIANRIRILKITLWASVIVGIVSLIYSYVQAYFPGR